MNGQHKYPRTPHLPQSPGATSDDKWANASALRHLASGIDLIATEKMDGGNVTLAANYFHARSLSEHTPAWERYAKGQWATLRTDIPPGWRLSCESMWARRSVPYEDLPGPLLLIGLWNACNKMLDWDSTVEWSTLLALPTVPLLYRGTDFAAANRAWQEAGKTPTSSEGFVIRSAGTIPYCEFAQNTAKWVRAEHITTDASWRRRNHFETNGIR